MVSPLSYLVWTWPLTISVLLFNFDIDVNNIKTVSTIKSTLLNTVSPPEIAKLPFFKDLYVKRRLKILCTLMHLDVEIGEPY